MKGRIAFASACLLASAACPCAWSAQPSPVGGAGDGLPTTERAYLEDLPVVLSATHLRQTLADAPAAVTVIDRDFIRRSGARDVNELFRLVPGFQVGADNGAHPLLYYHGVFDEFPRRLQVLVDGRSVFLPLLLGQVDWNAVAVAIEDIERIEVIRGSNAAAYGDNAFLGMVSIVTRHAADSIGTTVLANVGNDGIRDAFARRGWGNPAAAFRLSLRDQSDHGLTNAYDDRHVSTANLRADLNPSGGDEVMVSIGASRADAGQGYVDDPSNLAHTQHYRSDFLQGDWHHPLDAGGELHLSASHVDDEFVELVPVPLGPPLPADLLTDESVSSSRDSLGAERTQSPAEGLRIVWGGEAQRDRVVSRGLMQPGPNYVSRWRLYGNAEWRALPWLLINAGGLEEHDTLTGSRFAPRFMANFRVAENQTLRAGISRAYRAPSITELRGDFRVWSGNTLFFHYAMGNPDFHPESLLAREISYLADLPAAGLHIDVRAFDERISDLMRLQNVDLPPGANVVTLDQTRFVTNGADVTERGVEYQADWRPREGTRLILAQTFLHVDATLPDTSFSAPTLSAPTTNTSIALFQDLPGANQLSLMRYSWGAMTWQGIHERLDAQIRTDLRLAHSFRLGETRGELALTVQNLNHPYTEFVQAFQFDRRVFATLRFDL
jgi:iron complex outermembrane receptor protein